MVGLLGRMQSENNTRMIIVIINFINIFTEDCSTKNCIIFPVNKCAQHRVTKSSQGCQAVYTHMHARTHMNTHNLDTVQPTNLINLKSNSAIYFLCTKIQFLYREVCGYKDAINNSTEVLITKTVLTIVLK